MIEVMDNHRIDDSTTQTTHMKFYRGNDFTLEMKIFKMNKTCIELLTKCMSTRSTEENIHTRWASNRILNKII